MSVSAPKPELPKDPAQYRPRAGLGGWAMTAFAILCVLAGVGVALFVPRFMGDARPPVAPPPATVAAPPASSPATQVQAQTALVAAEDEVARLKARIAVLESQGARTSEAAAAAFALAELVDATRSSRPFPRELAALRATAPELPELAALTRLAETGAPSRTALAASFPDYAALAVRKARKPPEGSDVGQRLAYAMSKAVTIRRVDETAGTSPDALVARAERALEEGEVIDALKALEGLPPKAKEALAPWRMGAERRAQIDREVSALRARAIRDLQAGEPSA
jgi:hypothetical protein